MSEGRMTAEQTPDIEGVLAEHSKVDVLHGFYTCACGRTLGGVGVTPADEVNPRHRAHVAEVLAPVLAAVVREARAAAWDEGYERRAASLGMDADPNPYRADRIAVDAPETSHAPHVSYEPCVIDAEGNCTRWSHDHALVDAPEGGA